jgi:hypothetical protein
MVAMLSNMVDSQISRYINRNFVPKEDEINEPWMQEWRAKMNCVLKNKLAEIEAINMDYANLCGITMQPRMKENVKPMEPAHRPLRLNNFKRGTGRRYPMNKQRNFY